MDSLSSVECTVRPARPRGLARLAGEPCTCVRRGDVLVLRNGFLEAEVSTRSGVLLAVTNRLAGHRFVLDGDAVGFSARGPDGAPHQWPPAEAPTPLSVEMEAKDDAARVVLTADAGLGAVRIVYELTRARFWVERHMELGDVSEGTVLDRVVYGRLSVQDAGRRELELGRFDRPALLASDDGQSGLFGGVAWWFYTVSEDGLCENRDADCPLKGDIRFEPFYVGVFRPEPGEPYAGWLWYRTFLEDRKRERDCQSAWCHWNAGWGMSETEVNSPHAAECLDLAERLGIPHVLFGEGGHGHGLPGYVDMARADPVARRTLDDAARRGIVCGSLDYCRGAEAWADPDAMRERHATLGAYADAGFGAAHFDFFSTVDTFVAHRNVAAYFRAAREKLAYTECHLGMAAYGPQFQAEVLINHPTDTHRFSIQPFSSDWCTFLSFRASRADWQRQRDYLMPEYGLYYFVTHYRNPCGAHRAYTDPEPQQFITGIPAYTGISLNFHDVFGLRRALIATAAFSPFVVLGYVEPTIPEPDVRFVREALRWVRENADALRPGRVAFEDEAGCVVSKIVDGRGALFLVNYGPAAREFRVRLETGIPGAIRLRQVFPAARPGFERRDGESLTLALPGESVVVFDVNDGLRTPPPQDGGPGEIVLGDWTRVGRALHTRFETPQLSEALAARADPALPCDLESLDQLGRSVYPRTPDGRLPQAYLAAFGFREGGLVETWKLAPWAFGDLMWLLWCPEEPRDLGAPLPEVRLDGEPVRLVPRVDTRPGEDAAEWVCPLFFADITGACADGGEHELSIDRCEGESPGLWRVVWAGR